MSSLTTQRFVILALIITLSLSVWSGYLYSQTYRLSQESNLKLAEMKQDLREATALANEAVSKLDAANKVFSEANRKLEEADKILKETESLLHEVRNQGIANTTSITIDQRPQIYHFAGETLLAARLNVKVSSPSRYTVYYESDIVNGSESILNFTGRTYGFAEFARTTNAQTDPETPVWNERPKTLGTDVPQVTLWIGLRGLAFQRHGVLLLNPKEDVTVGVSLRLQITQAHTNLVMHQAVVNLVFEIGSGGQSSLRIVE